MKKIKLFVCFIIVAVVAGIQILSINRFANNKKKRFEEFINKFSGNNLIESFDHRGYEYAIGKYIAMHITEIEDERIIHEKDFGALRINISKALFDEYSIQIQKELFDTPLVMEYPDFFITAGDRIIYKYNKMMSHGSKLIVDNIDVCGVDYYVYGHSEGSEILKDNLEMYKNGEIDLVEVYMTSSSLLNFKAVITETMEDGRSVLRLKSIEY